MYLLPACSKVKTTFKLKGKKKMKKLTNHIKNHKVAYGIVGGIAAAACFVGGYFLLGKAPTSEQLNDLAAAATDAAGAAADATATVVETATTAAA